MMKRRYAAIAAAILLCASPALAQDKKPPLRTGVDGTFAPHAMPKLGGGVEGGCGGASGFPMSGGRA